MQMHDYRNELIKRYGAEECAGNLIATVEGKRQIIAKFDGTGVMLTPVGQKLESASIEEIVVEVEPPPAPKNKGGRPRKVSIPTDESDTIVEVELE